jgi:hypothetical protein
MNSAAVPCQPQSTNEDHCLGFRVILKHLEHINEAESDYRVSTESQAGALPYPVLGELIHHLVGKGTRAGDYSHRSRHVDVTGHDTYLAALFWRYDPWCVRAHKASPLLTNRVKGRCSVKRRYALGYADNNLNPRHGLKNRSFSRGRTKIARHSFVFFRIKDRAEDGNTIYFLTLLPGVLRRPCSCQSRQAKE